MTRPTPDDVDLHPESQDYLDNVWDKYDIHKLDSETKTVKNKAILQLYKDRDTRDEDGSLLGYADSLFFRAVLFDPFNDVAWISTRLHDGVTTGSASRCEVQFFKDESTMLRFNTSVLVRFRKRIQVEQHIT